jgi:hypothetical protein
LLAALNAAEYHAPDPSEWVRTGLLGLVVGLAVLWAFKAWHEWQGEESVHEMAFDEMVGDFSGARVDEASSVPHSHLSGHPERSRVDRRQNERA